MSHVIFAIVFFTLGWVWRAHGPRALLWFLPLCTCGHWSDKHPWDGHTPRVCMAKARAASAIGPEHERIGEDTAGCPCSQFTRRYQ